MKSLPLLPLLLSLIGALCDPAQGAGFPDDHPRAEAGTFRRVLEVDEVERQYLLRVPRAYDAAERAAPMPLVLMLHGRGSNGSQAASDYYGWGKLAEEEGFIAVFPTALGTPTSWRHSWAGRSTNDSLFLAALIDELMGAYDVDPLRVFMTGHSSGGFMSYSFAATHGEKVAAIGPVAGLSMDRARPDVPVSVVSFHGTADRTVPYGRNRWGAASAMGSVERFAEHGECEPLPAEELPNGRVRLDRWSNRETGIEVALYSIEGGGHGWPRSRRRSVPATEVIWAFFEAHPRRPAEEEAESEARGASEEGPEEKGPEEKGPEEKGPEEKGPEEKGPKKQGPEEAGDGGGGTPRPVYRNRTEGWGERSGTDAGDARLGSSSLRAMSTATPLPA